MLLYTLYGIIKFLTYVSLVNNLGNTSFKPIRSVLAKIPIMPKIQMENDVTEGIKQHDWRIVHFKLNALSE
jgi:hypothetical protein